MISVAAFLIGGFIGFGLGRVKNASKLAAVQAEIKKIETSASAEVAKLIAAIKAKL